MLAAFVGFLLAVFVVHFLAVFVVYFLAVFVVHFLAVIVVHFLAVIVSRLPAHCFCSCLLAVGVGRLRGFLLFCQPCRNFCQQFFCHCYQPSFRCFYPPSSRCFVSRPFLFLSAIVLTVLADCSSHLFSIPVAFSLLQ